MNRTGLPSHRLLVAVSASPYSEQMVRWTRRLADSQYRRAASQPVRTDGDARANRDT